MDSTIAKLIVSFIAGAVFGTSWWAAIIFRGYNDGVLFLPAVVLTFGMVVLCVSFLLISIIDD